MKIHGRFVLVISLGLALGGSVFADSSTPQPQPCDPSWNACAIGRADPFDAPSTGEAKGSFLIDLLYTSQSQISSNNPMIGQSSLGAEDDETPYIQAYAAPGSVDVMLQVEAQAGQKQSVKIGTISAPIGTDVSTYYTREVVLNPGVKISEGPTQTTDRKYCDPGGVFGAEIYNQQFSDTTYVISGASPAPISFHVQRMLIKSSYPAFFGCGN